VIYQRQIPFVLYGVMLSDPSSAFEVGYQDGLITANGVETSLNGVRCFDSVLDSSPQAGLAASFNTESLNMTSKVKMQ
jgi:hypothetical protein